MHDMEAAACISLQRVRILCRTSGPPLHLAKQLRREKKLSPFLQLSYSFCSDWTSHCSRNNTSYKNKDMGRTWTLYVSRNNCISHLHSNSGCSRNADCTFDISRMASFPRPDDTRVCKDRGTG